MTAARPPTGAARDMRRLARLLSKSVGVQVRAEYHGRPSSGGYGGWHLGWSAGPTRAEMRAAADGLASEVPGVDVAVLRWDRSTGSDQATAAAVLGWLDAHPDDADRVAHVDDDELPGWPDQLDGPTQVRAATLVAAGWRAHTAGAAHDDLVRYAAIGGPYAVAEWLDALASTQDAPVISLAERRGRHRTD